MAISMMPGRFFCQNGAEAEPYKSAFVAPCIEKSQRIWAAAKLSRQLQETPALKEYKKDNEKLLHEGKLLHPQPIRPWSPNNLLSLNLNLLSLE